MSDIEAVRRLTRDEVKATMILGDQEVRFLVDSYYQRQDARMRSKAQIRATEESGEPNLMLDWMAEQDETMEGQLKRALDHYTLNHEIGSWMRSITGLGPVITAGLLAHIDIEQAPTVGHIWSYAGLVPGVKWNRGQKRPWNASLRRLCWLLGESFVKVSSNEKDFYGKIYKERKAYETAKNENGDYADQARNILDTKNIGKDTDAYKAYIVGKLPPAHIHSRAKRYAVKLFLSHLHHVWYVKHYNRQPPNPYPIDHMGHAHIIAPPNFPA